ncbi:unnamed protein product [Dovyalis caffra]|uniref:Uncharacterized protein n=1 Tax=Dovyalis caffra TaxID=77055 RepID=A0AAV1QVK0_9ROSI|nr:unnamed protein product [Dovyalis caffra]
MGVLTPEKSQVIEAHVILNFALSLQKTVAWNHTLYARDIRNSRISFKNVKNYDICQYYCNQDYLGSSANG